MAASSSPIRCLFHQRKPYRHTVVAVGNRIRRRGYQRGIDLMIEVSTERDAFAQYIVCRKLKRKRAGSACRLRKVLFDTAYQRLIVPPREVGIQSQVIVHPGLRSFDFKNRFEIGYLVAGTYGHLLRRRFDNLHRRRIQR